MQLARAQKPSTKFVNFTKSKFPPLKCPNSPLGGNSPQVGNHCFTGCY